MRFTQSWLAVGALVVAGLFARDGLAKPSLEERVEHIELSLKNKVTLEMLDKVEALQVEVQHLHGNLEEQQHAIEMLTQRQEKLFLNLEQRIGQLPIPKNSAAQTVPFPQSSPTVPVVMPKPETPKLDAHNIERHSLSNGGTAINQTASEKDLYNSAYKLVDTKRYKEATVALQDFLWQFPDGQYAANAHYWLGEIYLSEWHSDKGNKLSLDKAISSFKTVIIKYATHHKAADSLLKLGLIEEEQENWSAAKEYFLKLRQQYPGSSRAHMADIRLQQIKQ